MGGKSKPARQIDIPNKDAVYFDNIWETLSNLKTFKKLKNEQARKVGSQEYNNPRYKDFSEADFEKLFKHDLPIISGIYRRATGHGKVEQLSDKFACSLLGGKTLRDADIKGKTTPMEVHANGFGFMLVKAEVFNRVITPFQPTNDTEWEDFAFAERARKLGYKSYIDPSIIVGHEKKLIL